jgi:opacity protein-like surface antigen
MKEGQNNLDEYFRKKLEGKRIEPSKSVWKSITRKFPGLQPGAFNLLNLQNILLVVAIVGAGVTAYVLWPSHTIEHPQAAPLSEAVTLIQPEEQYPHYPSDSTYLPGNNHDRTHGTPEPVVPLVFKENNPSPLAPAQVDGPFQLISAPPLNEDPVTGDLKTSTIFTGLTPLQEKQNVDFGYRVPVLKPFPPQQPVQWKDDYGLSSQISIGLAFQPEWINYRTGSGKFSGSFNQEVNATILLKDFILRTGIGIARAQDEGTYKVDYEQYESVGYYYDITSFTGVEGYPDSVIFIMGVVEVYDTVLHQDQVMTDNAYTYLQIPLQVGYRFLSLKRFSMFAVGGPTYSFLLNANEKAPTFEFSNAELVSVDNNTPVRRNSNWQFLFGIGAEYRITDKISVTAEPTYRQYLKPIYEGNSAAKPPYSLGVRAGIQFNF